MNTRRNFSRVPFVACAALGGVLLTTSCRRESRALTVQPPNAERTSSKQLSTLSPGPEPAPQPVKNPYEENAYALSEGKRLFSMFNCVGCHAHGGGDIGPPLMDAKWIYGSAPEQIFASIVEGRPNGMPSFRGKIADYQVWQLAAYVRSLSGLVSSAAAPSRSDEMQMKAPEQSMKKEKPSDSVPSKSGERPE